MASLLTNTCPKLDVLLDRDVEAEKIRESSWYDQLTRGRGERMVLFGAGNNGRKLLHGLRSVGIEPLAFADNSPGLWQKSVDGLPVFGPREAARRFGGDASFVVTIFSHNPGRQFPTIRRQLRALGCSCVVPFGALAWKYSDLFLPNYCLDLPHKIVEDAEGVREAYRLWADEHSRREYLAQLRLRTALDFDGIIPPQPGPEYFPPTLIQPRDDEVFVDCGAFDGDTIRSFLNVRGEKFGKIFALEPDPANFEMLAAGVSRFPENIRQRIELYRAGAGLRREKVRFTATGNTAAAISNSGDTEIDCVPLDEVLAGQAPSYIKMDIEGAEPMALAGTATIIGQHAPVLAICVYHCQDHLWRIPLQIQALGDNYLFFLRRYQPECWEVVCYAVPRDRLHRFAPFD